MAEPLLPNLEALLDELTGDQPAVQDARELAEAARGTTTAIDLDTALAAVVEAWRAA